MSPPELTNERNTPLDLIGRPQYASLNPYHEIILESEIHQSRNVKNSSDMMKQILSPSIELY